MVIVLNIFFIIADNFIPVPAVFKVVQRTGNILLGPDGYKYRIKSGQSNGGNLYYICWRTVKYKCLASTVVKKKGLILTGLRGHYEPDGELCKAVADDAVDKALVMTAETAFLPT